MLKKLILLYFLTAHVNLFSQNIDIRLLRAFNSSETLSSDNFFRFISNSEVYVVTGVPVGMAVAGLLGHDDKLFRNGCVTLGAIAVDYGIVYALKYSLNRDRPYVTYPDITRKSDDTGPAFPSGHTSGAFATATSISLAYPRWYVILPSYAWAGTVGYSRMHLGAHYPSDVLAGALIGSGSAYLSYKINQKLNLKKRKKPCSCPR
jgi:membrane-associated phospholipid phosphatase